MMPQTKARTLFHDLSTIGDHYFLGWQPVQARVGACCFHLRHNIHSREHLTKHHVLVVKIRGGDRGDEKLRVVGIRSSVSHGQNARFVVFQNETLILKRSIVIYARAAGAISRSDISTLTHETRNNSVEDRTLVREVHAGLGALAKGPLAEHVEILNCARYGLSVKPHLDAPSRLVIDFHIEENLFCDFLQTFRLVLKEQLPHGPGLLFAK
mmetsp:Transcript_13891/g.23494  ORF Transcript_13891/g.23494 Transcript_13891/m.23494 type:complete len:211 (-) Transcript_13891:489-1121(-)